jgi:hypothetical protein
VTGAMPVAFYLIWSPLTLFGVDVVRLLLVIKFC